MRTRPAPLSAQMNQIVTSGILSQQLAMQALMGGTPQARIRSLQKNGRMERVTELLEDLKAQIAALGKGERSSIVAKERETIEARNTAECQVEFREFLRLGMVPSPRVQAALRTDDDRLGGFMVAPEQLALKFSQAKDDLCIVRRLATVDAVLRAASMGVPTIATDPADADWTTELASVSEDSSLTFGKRVLYPRLMQKQIKVSRGLLLRSPNVEDKVIERLAFKFALPEEKAFLTGDGIGKPLGLFTASSDGISTGRDVSTGNTTTAIGADGLIEALHALKSQYWPSASWLFSRAAIKQIRKLKDGNGQYLLASSPIAGQPDMLLGRPCYVSEYVPSTFTAGQYVGIIGDFSHYWVVDSLLLQIQRLSELYAEQSQVGFIARSETDGMPLVEEAFARVTLAA